MRKCLLMFFSFFSMLTLVAQKKANKSADLFADEKPLQLTITTDIRNLLAEKKSMRDVDAAISFKLTDSSLVEENIKVRPRGKFRRENCYLSSLMLLFNSNPTNKLAYLKSLKLVACCGKTSTDEQYLLKEYLVYKIYNQLTEYSFRVKLLQVTFIDSKKKVKTFSQYAFLLEDADDLAKRNKHQQKKIVKYTSEGLQRHQMTLMCMFQYMIGNTDWSIPNYHNIKLLVPRKDTNIIPLPVPYDFDMSGAVNPPYAGTNPIFVDIEKPTDRLYRGFAVSTPEIEKVVGIFLSKEQHIRYLVQQFPLLERKYKNELLSFLNDFYAQIKNKSAVMNTFIKNARRE